MGESQAVLAYVGAGSNLDDPVRQVCAAIDNLGRLTGCTVVGTSSLYRSAPMGPSDQPDFVNAVIALSTTRCARDLFYGLLEVEATQGRVRDQVRWGPRRIDLDLLVYGELRMSDSELTVPHSGIAQRAFVLYPLHELAPQLIVPGIGRVDGLVKRFESVHPHAAVEVLSTVPSVPTVQVGAVGKAPSRHG